jgi:hypothetical protein
MLCACYAILSSVAFISLPCFATLSLKWHDFGGGGGAVEGEMCVLILYTTFETFLSVRIIHRVINL